MQSATILVIAALAAGAVANPIGWGPNSSPAEVAAARAAHLAEVARITNDRLSALAAANARAPVAIVAPAIASAPVIAAPVLVQSAPQPIQDNPDVAIARAAHLAELNRQTSAALSALAAVQARPVIAAPIAIAAPAFTIPNAPDVAAARAAHLAEVQRITNARLSALAIANAADGQYIAYGGAGKIYG